MTAARRAPASGGSGPEDPLQEIVRDLVRTTKARAAFVVSSYGAALAAVEAGPSTDAAPEISRAGALGDEVAEALLADRIVRIDERVTVVLCRRFAALFVVAPSALREHVDRIMRRASERIAEILAVTHGDVEPLTASRLAALLRSE